jgi:hypothetical protein
MNREDMIRMAREAGATPYTNRHYPDRPTHTFNPEQLERFANLVADAEAAKWAKGAKISIPTATMEQEFSAYHRRGFEAGKLAATEEANRRANASWTLMCEKMVAAEREAMVAEAAKRGWAMKNDDPFEDAVREIADARARGQQ